MSIDTLKSRLPAYAKDLKLNLGSVLSDPNLTEQQAWGAALASAVAARNPELLAAIGAEAGQRLSSEAVQAAKTAAAIMGMTNVYYRFTHLTSNPAYREMPARLRMNALAKPGVEPVDFELWALAVSAVNGCGACVDSHEKVVAQKGASKETVQAVARIAAVIHAVAVVLDAAAIEEAAEAAAA